MGICKKIKFMRNLLFWVILAVVGGVCWVVSVVLAVVSGGHEVFKFLANLSGIVMVASLPVGLLVELIKYIKNRK